MTPPDPPISSNLQSTPAPKPNGPSVPPPLVERLPDPEPPKRIASTDRRPSVDFAARARQPRATPEQEAEAEKYLRQANLLRVRGELKQSLAELVKAMEANPYDPTPHLHSAEILRNVGRPDDAIAVYERAIEMMPEGPARAAAETKLGRLVMEQQELNSTDRSLGQGAGDVLDRSRISTILASVIVPGLGQWIAGHRIKATIMVICLALSVKVPSMFFGHGTSITRIAINSVPGVLVWLWAVIDASVESTRSAGIRKE